MDALPGVTPTEGGLSRFVDATVVSVDPLLVRRDGDEAGLEALSLVDPATLVVDDRVRCELDARRVIIHGRAGGGHTLASSVTTSSLANNAEWQGTILLAQAFVLLHLTTSVAARVRVYASDAYRDADAARQVGVMPSGDHGLIFEGTTESGALSYVVSPAAVGGNLDAGAEVAVSVQNRSGSTSEVEVQFSWR